MYRKSSFYFFATNLSIAVLLTFSTCLKAAIIGQNPIIGTKYRQVLKATFDIDMPFKSDAKEPHGNILVVRSAAITNYDSLTKATTYLIRLDSIMVCENMSDYEVCTSINDPAVQLPPQLKDLKSMIGVNNQIILDSNLNMTSCFDSTSAPLCLLMLHIKNIKNQSQYEQETILPIPNMNMELNSVITKKSGENGIENYSIKSEGNNLTLNQNALVDSRTKMVLQNDFDGVFKYMIIKLKLTGSYISQ